MRSMLYVLAIALFLLGTAGLVMAQEVVPMPDIYNAIFAASMVQAIGAVVGFTQLINNIAKLHGWAAVGLAFATSVGYSFVMYLANGIWFCFVVGLAAFVPAALAYKATRAVGRAV